jgi:hypothetical protein
MALDRASVLAYLETHSTVATANHFRVSDRYIRKLRSQAAPAPVINRPSQDSAASTISAAAPGRDWVRVPGRRGLVRVVTNGLQVPPSAGAAEIRPDLCSSIQSVPVPVPDLNSSSGTFPAVAPASVAVAAHNQQCFVPLAVRRSAPVVADRASVLGWFLAVSVGPVPLVGWLVAVLVIWLAFGVR